MAYREKILCAYCDDMEVARCARCRCRLCEAHRPAAEDGWCWACAKEIKDEFDLLDFKAIINVPNERLPDGSEKPSRSWIAFGHWVASIRMRRAHKTLVERTRTRSRRGGAKRASLRGGEVAVYPHQGDHRRPSR
jgi:hypothetical protein